MQNSSSINLPLTVRSPSFGVLGKPETTHIGIIKPSDPYVQTAPRFCVLCYQYKRFLARRRKMQRVLDSREMTQKSVTEERRVDVP